MSLSKLLASRKQECAVWEYYQYDAATDKSTCSVLVDKDNKKVCGTKLSGKNSTNLVAHLRRMHKDSYACLMEKEATREAAKKDTLKRKAQNVQNSPNTSRQIQTLQDCIQ